jgi:hypothetical protein
MDDVQFVRAAARRASAPLLRTKSWRPSTPRRSGQRSTRSAVGICSSTVPRRIRRPRPTRANSSTNDLPRHECRHPSHQSAQRDGSRPIRGPSKRRAQKSFCPPSRYSRCDTDMPEAPAEPNPTGDSSYSSLVACPLRPSTPRRRRNPRSSRGARNADRRLRHPHRRPGAPSRRDARHLKHARVRARAGTAGGGLGGVRRAFSSSSSSASGWTIRQGSRPSASREKCFSRRATRERATASSAKKSQASSTVPMRIRAATESHPRVKTKSSLT